MSFRPRTSRYLPRPRLLSLLPERPGSVVWLEAPYGYGKSVLASQWAASLEPEGWRVIWVAADADDLRRTVADGLSLPTSSPWGAVLETLWSEPTVLVLEDLENLADHEELVPLLRDPRGLLLLASRGPLRTSEIPRLLTSGRLTHLRSSQLGFTEREASALMSDAEGWKELWQQAGGWPLPLHFAALTGELPDGQQLLSGLRGSLAPAEWQEALLLSTLPDLPADAGTKETARRSNVCLVGSFGLQALHPIGRAHPRQSRCRSAALKRRLRGRLDCCTGGARAARRPDELALAGRPQTQLSRQALQTVLRWDAAARTPFVAPRDGRHGQHGARSPHRSQKCFQAALDQGGLDETESLQLKGLVWSLALTDPWPQLESWTARRHCWRARTQRWRVGSWRTPVRSRGGRRSRRGVCSAGAGAGIPPPDSRFRVACHINLALNR